MDRAGDQKKRLIRAGGAVPRLGLGCVDRRRPPRILLPVDESETVVGDVVSPNIIHGIRVRRSRDVEGVAADKTLVLEGLRAGDNRELVFGNTRAGL